MTEAPRLTKAQIVGSLAGLLLTLLLAALDQTVVGPALPRVVASLGGLERYAWVATAYLLCSTVMVPIAGKLADLYGRKILLLAGAALFVAASALCGIAATMNQLIAFRGLQGLGGGMIMALAFTVVGDLFDPAQRARYQGLFGAVWGVASLVGPLLGGWLTDHFTWRWVFLVNVPVGAVALAVLGFYFHDTHEPDESGRLDLPGIGLFLLAIVPALLAASGAPLVLLIPAGAALIGFLKWESVAPEPLMPFRLFRIHTFWVSVVSVTSMGVVLFGAVLYIPLFVQAVLGRSATTSGVVLTPMTLMMVLSSFLGGQLLARFGNYRNMALIGLTVMIAGQVLLGLMDGTATSARVTWNLLVLGVGVGLAMPLYPVLVQNAVARHELGTATSLITFFRSIGGTVGATVWGGFIAHRLGGVDMGALMHGTGPAVGPEMAGAFTPIYAIGAALLVPVLLLNTLLPQGLTPAEGRSERPRRAA